ncbi:hypothetical protein LSTR_LSTR003695 [Laodelphax striatellus]|uniref:Uncharacterized protein n=1 Tax=Laodelphax striatellus TaxID=195883 RepID=A0A482XC56_LAOST|nr:hypothetical protein LSTR_LSTR003695 [Laodelphax striatellus]
MGVERALSDGQSFDLVDVRQMRDWILSERTPNGLGQAPTSTLQAIVWSQTPTLSHCDSLTDRETLTCPGPGNGRSIGKTHLSPRVLLGKLEPFSCSERRPTISGMESRQPIHDSQDSLQ